MPVHLRTKRVPAQRPQLPLVEWHPALVPLPVPRGPSVTSQVIARPWLHLVHIISGHHMSDPWHVVQKHRGSRKQRRMKGQKPSQND
ncbi:hypothetical protein PUNSTDRAFT_119543 [Punctularia strigosozonata HHB-11173 SS5]|uniref:uncharacterized protein n=1 Tax=Punctularia strigosozonata (strain HHB-11173) TaxID=741275 RepID=UPI0004416A5C|nr:uncharacterized protein PUNSTDRAFT_119543 [Punctularia strigosozonata HHB-11173 SS5]EIN10620.1 hypothetical protein PUNSTDRAFT_119543 [Punctularia strigosozonata HHB-11173 SS5]